MTPEIFRLRRRIEALEEHLDEQAEQVALGIWAVPSRSRPDDFHLVTRTPEGTIVCDCPSNKHGKYCRHIAAVELRLEWKAIRLQADAPKRTALKRVELL